MKIDLLNVEERKEVLEKTFSHLNQEETNALIQRTAGFNFGDFKALYRSSQWYV